MPDQDPNDVKEPAEPVIPAISEGTPLPGQDEPHPEGGQPEADPDEGKVVPLKALHEERTKRQELQAEMEILKQIAGDNVLFDINGRPVPNQPQPGQQQQQHSNANNTSKEIEQLWETDPRKAVQVEIMAAMSWRDSQETAVDNQILAASQKYQDFSKFDTTVRQYIRALPLEQRSKPGVVDLAYYVVKGQNSGTAVEAAKAEMLRKIQAGEAVQGLQPGTRPTPPAVKKDQITDEQARVAEAMGLTPEQYMSARK